MNITFDKKGDIPAPGNPLPFRAKKYPTKSI